MRYRLRSVCGPSALCVRKRSVYGPRTASAYGVVARARNRCPTPPNLGVDACQSAWNRASLAGRSLTVNLDLCSRIGRPGSGEKLLAVTSAGRRSIAAPRLVHEGHVGPRFPSDFCPNYVRVMSDLIPSGFCPGFFQAYFLGGGAEGPLTEVP